MSLNEFDIIQRYFADLTIRRADVPLGIGDDCALLQPPAGQLLAVSTDTLVAGRHFPDNTSPEDIGFKSLAVNLSDLAAMGAEPAWVSLALTMPEVDEHWLGLFSRGFSQLARRFDLQLVGGDLTRGALSISLTIHGFVPPEKAMKRSGAQIGDLVCVSGSLGSAALALRQSAGSLLPGRELLKALNRPEPRVDLGRALGGTATSCIDISDGLVSDLGHICKASSCRAEILLEKLPCHPTVSDEVNATRSWEIPLSGGDDYELCFTLDPAHEQMLPEISKTGRVDISIIGSITAGRGVVCLDENHQQFEPGTTGYMHFI